MKAKLKLKSGGYVAQILTWHLGDNAPARRLYLTSVQNGCPLFWDFVFAWIRSLGGWRSVPKPKPLKIQYVDDGGEETAFSDSMNEFFDKYDRQINSVVGFCFFFIILILVVCFGFVAAGMIFREQASLLVALVVGLSILIILLVAVILMMTAIGSLLRSEPIRLLKVWVMAKKERVCPLITFE